MTDKELIKLAAEAGDMSLSDAAQFVAALKAILPHMVPALSQQKWLVVGELTESDDPVVQKAWETIVERLTKPDGDA